MRTVKYNKEAPSFDYSCQLINFYKNLHVNEQMPLIVL